MTQHLFPKVSVIISTHNRADMLPRAVNSVLNQVYDDFEIIIVDDASSDDTQAVIAGLYDPRIRSLRHDTNRGHSASINTGISHAKGEYIAFLDDDDEWLPNKLERQVAVFQSSPPEVALVYGWMDRIEDSTGRLIPSYRNTFEGNIFEHSLALNIPGPTIVLLMRASVAREVGGFDRGLTRFDDTDFICRVTQRYKIAVLPEVVAKAHFDHEHEQMGHDSPENLTAAANFLRMHMERFATELDSRPRTLATLLRRLAGVEMMRGNRRAALSALASAYKLDPVGVCRAILKNFRLAASIFAHLIASSKTTGTEPKSTARDKVARWSRNERPPRHP